MKRLSNKKLDAMLTHGRLAVDEAGDVRDLESALVLAHTLEARQRPLSSALVMRIIALGKHWKGHDIPAQIVEARKVWLRARDAKQLAAKLQGEEGA